MGGIQFAQKVNILMNPDIFRPLLTQEDFAAVPPCMYEAIVMHPPVKELLKQGRISGFGFDPDFLPEEDVFGRLINNGVCKDVLGSADENGKVTLTWEFHSTDPELSFGELDAIEATRDAIEKLLENTQYDPTDYPFE